MFPTNSVLLAAPVVDIDGTILVQGGLFLLMVFLLNSLLFKPWLEVQERRKNSIEGALEKADQLQLAAREKGEQYDEDLRQARDQAQETRSDARKAGEKSMDAKLEEARGAARQSLDETRTKIQVDADAARTALSARVDGLARDITMKILGEVRVRRLDWMSRFVAAWVLCLLPDLAFASPESGESHGGGHGNGDLSDLQWVALQPDEHGRVGFLWVLVNFAILLFVLNWLVFSKLKAGHHRNREQIKSELERATQAREGAEELLAEYATKIENLKGEVAEIKAVAKRSAEEDKKSLLAEAEAEAENIRAGAVAAGAREAERVRKEIEGEIIDRAVDAAEKAIRAQFGAADQRKTVIDYVTEVSAARIGGDN